ncbi:MULTISPECIES: UDP-N-acetylmuramate dehydrogenase [Caldisericum]|uniref:UDP-N-acetylenolpyruvoylglucosamine reductase n=1 Tax=Caldisericum exile TaxID=693075 RepID=A0A2J6WEC0_9BACT|nr:MAG: UDP-N-acetylenolpyruvoylglucosamine reductase [Caldisericum exile]
MKIQENIKELIKGRVYFNEPMAKHTSFKIGGPAEILAIPSDVEDLKKLLEFAKKEKLPITVIGNGTNILVSDDGIEGLVIKMAEGFSKVEFDNTLSFAEAGVPLQKLIEEASRRNLGGFEFAFGIPGALGGAIAMNAGTNSHYISTRIEYADVIDYNGKIYRFRHDDFHFDYRYSILQEEPLILLNAVLTFEQKPFEEILREKEKNIRGRLEKQPYNLPCAGSVFKNPPTTYAGRVLEESGCKGLRFGDALISEKHANFIVNLGNATAQDVVNLIREAQLRVYKQKDLILELEIRLVGKFKNLNLLERKK